MWHLLKHPVFGRLFAAQCVALIGTGLMTVALGLLAFDLAGANAGAVLGAALAIKMIAYVIITPLANALLANLPRKKVLITADLVRAAVALCLPFVSDVWQIYVLIFVLQTASATFTPTFQAVIPDVLPDTDSYTRGLSLSRLAYDLEALLSPVVAAILLGFISYSSLFLGTFCGFLVSAFWVWRAALPNAKPGKSVPFWQRVTRGGKLYLSTPRLRGLLALTMAAAAGGAMVFVNTVVLVRAQLARGEGDLAIALAAFGLGSMSVALMLPRLLKRLPDRIVMIRAAFVLSALLSLMAAILVADAAPAWGVVLLVWMLLGASYALIVTPTGRLIQRSSHPEDRPALFAAHFALSHACWLMTYPLAGWIGASLGLAAAFWASGVLALAAALAGWVLWPRHSADPIAHEHPELSPNHPHLLENIGHDGRHRHPVIIDNLHRDWPG